MALEALNLSRHTIEPPSQCSFQAVRTVGRQK
jgi:hypothetical protein